MTNKELQQLNKIATETFAGLEHREDLETVGNDMDDFVIAAVWEIKQALKKAYTAGKAAGVDEVLEID